jgi:hypothetical protein
MRAKIILPNFVAVLLLGTISYLFLKADLRQKAEVSLAERIMTVSALFSRSEALRGFDLLNSVNRHAMSSDTVRAFAPVEVSPVEGESQAQVDKKVHTAWYKRCVRAVELCTELWQEQKGNRPELVLLTDRKGVVIARNITPNACPTGYNIGSAIPVVKRALDGKSTYAIWSVDDSPFSSKKPNDKSCQLMNSGLLEVAAAPVWFEDNIAGSLVVGFEISNGVAKKNADMLNLDVAVIKGKDVYSSSMQTDTARQSLEQHLLLKENANRLDKAIGQGAQSDLFQIEVEGEPFTAVALPVHSADPKDRVVSIVMGSITEATRGLESLNAILIGMIAALLLVIAIGTILTQHFLKPVMQIEEGILKVLNGEHEYRFDVKSSEVGGLSYRINQLIGELTGEDEEPEDTGDGADA